MSKTMPNLELKHVTWDAANGFYIYQRRVHADAIWLLQRKKITVSLGPDPREAKARYGAIHAKWEKAITDAVERLHKDPDGDAFMDRAVLFVNAMMAQHGGTLPDAELAVDLHNWAARDQMWDKWAKWNLAHDGTKVRDILHEQSWEELNQLAVTWETFRAAHRRRVGLSAQLPSPLVDSNMPTADGQIVMSLTDLEERWLKQKKRSHAVESDMKRMVSLFVATNGNLPVHEITASHRLAFRDAVQAIPGIKAQSQNKLMRTLSALGGLAEKIGAVTSNPLRTYAFEVTDEIDVEPFTDRQLTDLFRSEHWKKRSPKYAGFLAWAFVIGSYTGARIGEIAQLRAEDVYKHEGEWVIEITFDDETGQKTKGRKTRLVPVSKHLIALGFLKLVKKIGKGQLFPEVRPDTKGNWSGLVSVHASALLRAMEFPEAIRFHSTRHTIKTRLRGKVADSVNDWITHPGGKKQSVAAKYGRVEIAAMKKAVDLLNYKVDWPELSI
jgi:integrase